MTTTSRPARERRQGVLAPPPRRVRSPGGLHDRSRIRMHRPGDTVDAGATPRGPHELFEALAPLQLQPMLATSTNWIAAAWVLNASGSPVSSFSTMFVVPPEPIARASQL